MGMVTPGNNPMWWALSPFSNDKRAQQMAMAYENAKVGKEGQIGAAEAGAAASIFGAKQSTKRQSLMGEQGMAEQGMKGSQAMEQQGLAGRQAMDVAGLRARTELGQQGLTRELGMKQLGQQRSALLQGGGGMEGGGSGIQNMAWENSKKRYDAFMKTSGGLDKDTGEKFTDEQKDSMLKRFYSQEMGFFK